MDIKTSGVLFDLDGTLVDTAEDLCGAVNSLLEEQSRQPLLFEALRPYVSQGGLKLVSVAFDIPMDSQQAQNLWHRYLEIYAQNLSVHSALFAGMEEVLNNIEKSARTWGVVTNKPERFTHPLLRALSLHSRSNSIVCGDTLAVSKPAPDPILLACKQLGCAPESTIMIGDDRRDIVSGKAAGCKTIAASWGYIQPRDNIASWGADAILKTPLEINEWLD